MRVVLSTPGTFHLFALARELESRGHLERIYTTYPWLRIKREGVKKSQVRTFPYVHPLVIKLDKHLKRSQIISDLCGTLISKTFDGYVAATLPHCDVFIASSGSGLRSGLRAKAMGATYVCDRGSSHMRYHLNLLRDEYARWGCAAEPERLAVLKREEAEYEAADLIFVPSEFSFRSFVEMGVPAEKLCKLVLSADVRRFYPVAAPAQDEFCVLYVGQVSFRKGIPYLLEAFRKLKHPNKRLRLIGQVEPRIHAYLQSAKLDQVEFEGSKPLNEVRQAMSEAHVTVLPSVEDGFGMVLAEAMACGSPVISTDNTGGSDLYQSGREGFIVPIRDPEALCAAMEKLAGDPALQESMGAAALKKMQELVGWQQYGDAVERLLLAYRALPGNGKAV